MTNLNIETVSFSAYQYTADEWVKWESDGSTYYGQVKNRTKNEFTVNGQTITGDTGDNVYKIEKYDDEKAEFTADVAAKVESELEAWSGAQNSSDDSSLSIEFEMDKEKVFSAWKSLVNMDEEQMEMWEEHPCSDVGVDNSSDWRDNTMMLLGQAPDGWNEESYRVANRVVAWARQHIDMLEEDAESGGKGTCPSTLAIKMLNRGINPFDEFPSGNPTFDEDAATEERLNDAKLAFAASALSPKRKEIIQDFNEHGIRENYDDDGNLVSVDAVFEAMEPGPPEDRNGVRITSEFLQNVAEKDYSDNPPYLMDHTKDTLSHIGFVKDVWFNESTEKLMLMARAYNTGSQTHDEIIKRLTFDPPTLTDGSVGFGSNYEDAQNDDGETELVDGKLREFSTTPFPAGYDDGGLKTNYDSDKESSEVGFIIAS